MDYHIRFAKRTDCDRITEFIDCNWKKGHILVRNSRLFHWQYDGDGERLNFVLGVDEDERIQGILGFIRYSNDLDSDICLALWKVNLRTGILGIELLKHLIEREPHRNIVCTGINIKTTGNIYSFLGFQVRKMNQWYRLVDRKTYKIATVREHATPKNISANGIVKVDRVDNADELPADIDNECTSVPFKSREYLQHRYFEHPVYDYLVYTYKDETKPCLGLSLVMRIQEYNGAKALRIIDGIGNWNLLEKVVLHIDSLMEQYDCEYADLVESGLDENLMCSSGWRKVGDDGNIIPDYFSPFEQKNVKIYCSTSSDKALLFKGDGDQDRPN